MASNQEHVNSERQLAEKAMLKSEELWRRVFENSAIGVALTTTQGRFMTGNIAYQRMLGYTETELRELSFLDITHEDDGALHAALLAELLEGSRKQFQIEKRYRRKDGQFIWVSNNVALVPGTESEPHFLMAIVEDITERKLAEEQLLLTKYTVDHIADSAFWVTSDARIVFVNDASCESLGYTREELLKLTVHDIDPNFPREVWADHWHDLREQQSLTLESARRRKDGHVFPVELSLNYLLYNGQEYNFVFARDITERKQKSEAMQLLTTRLLQLQDEERRRIARDLHDVTAQDLGAVAVNLAYLQRLVTDLKPEAQNLVTECTSLAEGVFQQIRTLSYLLHPPLLDQAGLASALRWYIEGFTRRSGIQVDIEIAQEIGRLSSEIETALFRIVQESLTNIHRHSGSGSAIIRLFKKEMSVILHVQDQGAGMTEVADGEVADNVQLLGLGILGMRQRLRQFGGKLEINTGKHGTQIITTIPLLGDDL